ncbi:phosphopyruvate hydratase [Candidatus Falkowbacteria bacterium CG_4_10_14_0_2_um_filter_41_15]|uniref:Enolase n=4 Tax=Candidatus Falkowiibacteriota TaxID=1752728 RepID=A0A2G9ZMF0_9BACT|nr:MAG: phosphopyruvate hydratase [Candidatus Falkowbacteria bacterium CG1_02_41_21]PIP34356.1 MAG: phosphopyruvate hydratase [Candidatus Falkowbacteria bacterium CG23_combo_of_CG06-09_8_20_14_all_41_10]PIZ09671.1 MAG: phosphopyruvate hydratase [Candidatus Falkowbacteria bacterium CG_4_10_14_0_8_um_filter_41_36]PJA08732.1 MAG: phosphopyruvate hydratase [Candidatus Falkowbacteria bacterium CG_4_10_14_0_2_um_filter_41_15]
MSKIKQVLAREILDSRGNPTVEAKVVLDNKLVAKAAVPSGASTGQYEVLELRDGDKRRYSGQGVLRAVNNINQLIAPKLKGWDPTKQAMIDSSMLKLDGTKNKSHLGANAILAVSLAVARAGALAKKQELFVYLAQTYKFPTKKYTLPTPSFNIWNGGAHASTNLDFQEFMIMPLKKVSFAEKVRMGAEVFHKLGKILQANMMDTDLGNEGGYAPEIKSREQVIELIILAIKQSGYQPGKDIALGMDIGSSEFFDDRKQSYYLPLNQKNFSAADLMALYADWIKKYPIVSIEDGLAENDWDNWRVMTKALGQKILLIGDDLFVTNRKRLQTGIEHRAGNAILIKLNQIGTVTETMETIKLAQQNNYKLMISHRSGETADDFIADLAVAVAAEYIKAGSLARSERLAKYNRLMEIELILNNQW